MAKPSSDFAKSLTKAIRRIAAETDHTIASVQDEIGYALKKEGGSLIEYWRRGNLPADLGDLEQLARELVTRSGLRNREELEKFLESGGHVKPEILSEELFPQPPAASLQPLYKRLYMHIERHLSLDGLATTTCQSEIQALGDSPLSSIRHRNWVAGGKFQDFRLEFKPGRRDGSGSMRTGMLTNSPEQLAWLIEFRPPLLKHQKASYVYTHSFRGECAMTYEQCHEQHQQGLRLGDFEFYRHTLRVPTDEFRLAMIFPAGYPISVPPSGGFAVYAGQSEHLQETARLRMQNCFSMKYDDHTDRWSLELIARPAAMGLGYQLRWIPPDAASIAAS